VVHQKAVYRQAPLALATSQIHRCRGFEELKRAFLGIVPQFVSADSFGMYLFNDQQETQAVFSHHAKQQFLTEYEAERKEDPLFQDLLQSKEFTHSLKVFEQERWFEQPLHDFLSRWGLNYTIEAPLIIGGKIVGTLNMARSSKSYFSKDDISSARFLCSEINYVYQDLAKKQEIAEEIASLRTSSLSLEQISGRAGQVLELAVRGDSNRSIADKLAISENTVRHHIKRIYSQLGVHNRAQLVRSCVV
jgi:DNA-binding CsgD family transcriptional regulator